MAKHQRPRAGSRSGSRSGSGRSSRPAGRPGAAPSRTGGLSRSEEARAAEIEAQIVEREQVAETERARGRDRRRTEESRTRDEALPRTRAGGLLAIRGEQEYTYVVRDVRRIVTVGGSLVGILFLLFLLIDVFGIIHI